jgi:hypothetical protein
MNAVAALAIVVKAGKTMDTARHLYLDLRHRGGFVEYGVRVRVLFNL